MPLPVTGDLISGGMRFLLMSNDAKWRNSEIWCKAAHADEFQRFEANPRDGVQTVTLRHTDGQRRWYAILQAREAPHNKCDDVEYVWQKGCYLGERDGIAVKIITYK